MLDEAARGYRIVSDRNLVAGCQINRALFTVRWDKSMRRRYNFLAMMDGEVETTSQANW